MQSDTIQRINKQSGVVAILTVLLFSMLLAILTVGFMRIMIIEQKQTLEDALGKSAYNSAQAGIEDAKRAIAYCNSPAVLGNAGLKLSCDQQLFNDQCPGFVSNRYAATTLFETNLGIPTINASAPAGSGVGDSTLNQGYSCVIVKKNTTNILGRLSPYGDNNSAMYELKTTSPYTVVKLFWHNNSQDGVPTIPDSPRTSDGARIFLDFGNPRSGAWSTDNSGATNAPAVMRITLITMPEGTFSLDAATMKTYFLYPAKTASPNYAFGITDANNVKTNPTVGSQRGEVTCTGLAVLGYEGYTCGVGITFSDGVSAFQQSSNRYILVQPLYRSTSFSIVARLNGTSADLPFDGAQYSIDSTGYASTAFRRVEARAHLGGNGALSGATLDLGKSLCKSFSVGRTAAVFDNSECN